MEKLESIEHLLKEQTLLKKKALNFKETLFLLGISKNTLYELMRKNKIPVYRPMGGKVFFSRKELEYWLLSHSNVSLYSVERKDVLAEEIHDSD